VLRAPTHVKQTVALEHVLQGFTQASQLVVLLVSKNPSAHKQFDAKFLVVIIPTQLRHSTPEDFLQVRQGGVQVHFLGDCVSSTTKLGQLSAQVKSGN